MDDYGQLRTGIANKLQILEGWDKFDIIFRVYSILLQLAFLSHYYTPFMGDEDMGRYEALL